jgi:protein-S-isoprenylcysteine O-methyltransferase Ste14
VSLIPSFEIGVWNAWVFIVPFILATMLCLFFMMKKDAPGGPARVPIKSVTTMVVALSSKIIYLPALIYSIFLPLKSGDIWFYIGLPVTIVGFIGSVFVVADWAIVTVGEPITRGLYKYSRHPMYITGFITLFGVGILSASWVFLLLAIIFGIGTTRQYYIKIEEAQCLGRYKAAYREYMNKTPRWLGIPKS